MYGPEVPHCGYFVGAKHGITVAEAGGLGR